MVDVTARACYGLILSQERAQELRLSLGTLKISAVIPDFLMLNNNSDHAHFWGIGC